MPVRNGHWNYLLPSTWKILKIRVPSNVEVRPLPEIVAEIPIDEFEAT